MGESTQTFALGILSLQTWTRLRYSVTQDIEELPGQKRQTRTTYYDARQKKENFTKCQLVKKGEEKRKARLALG